MADAAQSRTTAAGVAVRRRRAQEWAKVRELRLRMLADTPIAFLETREQALAADEREWRFRARRGAAGNANLDLVAEALDGTWVGTMSCYVDRPGGAMLVGVFVEPAFRGRDRGVTDALLAAVETWAAGDAAASVLRLLVHEDNARALAYYRAAGFVETGETMPYDLDPSRRELEMAKPLVAVQ